jgi:hypothetical protein
VAIERIAVRRLGVEHELAAVGLGCRRRDRGLAAELIGRPGLALADAFDVGGVQRIDLVPALAVVLEAHPVRQGEEIGKALLESLVAGDLAADVADHPAEPDCDSGPCFSPSVLRVMPS